MNWDFANSSNKTSVINRPNLVNHYITRFFNIAIPLF